MPLQPEVVSLAISILTHNGSVQKYGIGFILSVGLGKQSDFLLEKNVLRKHRDPFFSLNERFSSMNALSTKYWILENEATVTRVRTHAAIELEPRQADKNHYTHTWNRRSDPAPCGYQVQRDSNGALLNPL